jgi:hypothetical protein
MKTRLYLMASSIFIDPLTDFLTLYSLRSIKPCRQITVWVFYSARSSAFRDSLCQNLTSYYYYWKCVGGAIGPHGGLTGTGIVSRRVTLRSTNTMCSMMMCDYSVIVVEECPTLYNNHRLGVAANCQAEEND